MMKVKELVAILQVGDQDRDVIVDGDENGFYTVTGVNTYTDEQGDELTNIVSSNLLYMQYEMGDSQ